MSVSRPITIEFAICKNVYKKLAIVKMKCLTFISMQDERKRANCDLKTRANVI